ncbi:MAG: hypothetical protein ABR907_01400 [Terracidiphilus sp.]|jgi:hypothetical protein
MSKVNPVVMSLGLAMMLTVVPVLNAQSASKAPAAPLPSQILTAKTVFISNAGGCVDDKLWSGGRAQPYNELYAMIERSGQYRLVATPAEADLIVQISYSDPLTGVGGSKESGSTSSNTPQLKLVLLDPKTSMVLWTFNEKTSIAHLEKGRDQALADSIGALVSDLKALTTQAVVAAK